MSWTLEYIALELPSAALILLSDQMNWGSTVVVHFYRASTCSLTMMRLCRCCKANVPAHAALLNLTSCLAVFIVTYA